MKHVDRSFCRQSLLRFCLNRRRLAGSSPDVFFLWVQRFLELEGTVRVTLLLHCDLFAAIRWIDVWTGFDWRIRNSSAGARVDTAGSSSSPSRKQPQEESLPSRRCSPWSFFSTVRSAGFSRCWRISAGVSMQLSQPVRLRKEQRRGCAVGWRHVEGPGLFLYKVSYHKQCMICSIYCIADRVASSGLHCPA